MLKAKSAQESFYGSYLYKGLCPLITSCGKLGVATALISMYAIKTMIQWLAYFKYS
jgi:energy-converting hydrogenase Eha subunit C